jgi:hypothetical protein
LGVVWSRCYKDAVDDITDFLTAKREKIGILESLLLPLHLAIIDPLLQAVVYFYTGRRHNDGTGACVQGLCAAGGSERVCADDEVGVAPAIEAGEEGYRW